MPTLYGNLNDGSQRIFKVTKMPAWPSLPVRFPTVPHRIRRKFRATKSRLRSRQSPASTITNLETSFDPNDTIRSLRRHRWSLYDAQYLVLAILGIFVLSVVESPGPFTKTLIASLFISSLLIPITRQFFLPFLPIAGYLFLFYSCKFIAGEYRPPIWVRILPALENILYGANLSNILSAHKSTLFDVLAWLPYGLAHFGAPFVCAGILFVWGPPGTLPVYARAFGYMNIIGVATQIIFPNSPPWYENKYGLAPANYSMSGSPAGLAAIDKLLGIDLYTSGFTASPMVFGAFPSLHAADATIEALFLSHVFPRLTPLFAGYTMWLWWATMYFSHHYAVDLAAGSLLAGACFYVAKSKFLPRVQPEKEFRWDYDYVQRGDADNSDFYQPAALYEEFRPNSDSDEWTIGSSSSVSSGTRSPSTGPRSPTDDHHYWEGDTLASASDHEYR